MAAQGRAGIFLDRDGVVVRLLTEWGPRETSRAPADLKLLPGAAEAIADLRQLGVPLILVTNQPNIAKGKTTREQHAAMEARLHELLGPAAALDAVYTCFHHPDPEQVVVAELCTVCTCRKPAPGLLRQAAADFNLDLAQSVMIGDDPTDILAGKRAGCRTVRILAAGDEGEPRADAVTGSLREAVPTVVHFIHTSTHVAPSRADLSTRA